MTEVYKSVTGEHYSVLLPKWLEGEFMQFHRDDWRRQKEILRYELPLHEECISAPEPVQDEGIGLKVRSILASLSQKQKKLVCELLAGHSVDEIAKTFNVAKKDVYNMLYRLKRRFA